MAFTRITTPDFDRNRAPHLLPPFLVDEVCRVVFVRLWQLFSCLEGATWTDGIISLLEHILCPPLHTLLLVDASAG